MSNEQDCDLEIDWGDWRGVWDYRIIHYDDDELGGYGIHEVYYTDDGAPQLVTVEPAGIVFDDEMETFRQATHLIRRAWNKPILPISIFRGDSQ